MYAQFLSKLAAKNLTRHLQVIESCIGPSVRINGREVLIFASNDYLGLASHPEVIEAAVNAVRTYGAGSGAARLISGSLTPHVELEQAIARFKSTEAALTFGSGYLANIGVIPALIGRQDLILADRLCHASLLDGCRLSGADFRVYRHNDMEHLKTLLSNRRQGRRTLIVTDGVFSMDGDLAPLPIMTALAQSYEAELYIDDAHGTGVMGDHGRGTVEHFKLEDKIPLHMGTLGKALGSSGAYLAGSEETIRYLLHTARSFMFSTASSPGTAAAATASLNILQREPTRRARLWANRERLFTGLKQIGFRLGLSASPIIPILIGDADRTVTFAENLLSHGVFAPAIRPPTVPESTCRLRVTITSEHTAEQIDQALAVFKQAGRTSAIL
ncbi:8-amino-7-oxononanoate synthase [Petrachloros mirabilis]